MTLVERAVAAHWPLRAIVADAFYGENETFRTGLARLTVGFVLALKPSHCWWHCDEDVGSLAEAAEVADWDGPERPGAWEPVVRTFRDGHAEVWWALEVVAGPYGPDEVTACHRCHDGPIPVAHLDDLVSGHQPAGPGERARSDEPAGAREPGGARAAVWPPDVGRAELQAGETCVGLGGISSAE